MQCFSRPWIRPWIVSLFTALGLASAGLASAELARTEPIAIGCGEATAEGFVVWGRGSGPGTILAEIDTDGAFSAPRGIRFGLDETRHFTGQSRVGGLRPDTEYHLRLSMGGAESVTGRCRTAPADDSAAGVRFVIGGDIGGQSYCRHAEHGYRIFEGIRARAPHFFIANGDSIYADGVCPAAGPEGWPNVPATFRAVSDPAVDWTDAAAVRHSFLEHWRYNSEDPHLAAFFAETPRYVQWDDHEIVNDFGAGWRSAPTQPDRAGWDTVVAEGRAAFLAYNPIGAAPARLYRKFRWGRDLELILLDGRSYRDRNDRPDGPGKTLLGEEQRHWLIDSLTGSEATWKVVSSNIPLAVPTGGRADRYGRDGFANGSDDDFSSRTGFEHELLTVLEAIEGRVTNLVFVVTDVHLAASLRHRVDLDGDGESLVFHELISGPLNAGMATTLRQLDPTLRPVILFSEGGVFNFGEVEITPATDGSPSRLVYTVRDERGELRPGSRLELTADPQPAFPPR